MYWFYFYLLYFLYTNSRVITYTYYAGKCVKYMLTKKKRIEDIEEDWIYVEGEKDSILLHY